MKWTVEIPRAVAEDNPRRTEVEAVSIEEAITRAASVLHGPGAQPLIGQVYLVHARVEVVKRPFLPLRSV